MRAEHALMFEDLRRGVVSAELEQQFPFYPLTSPGMPRPGLDFLKVATYLGDPNYAALSPDESPVTGWNLNMLYRRALYDEQFRMAVAVKDTVKTAEFVPGHRLGDSTRDADGGPRPSRVMLLGKNPGKEEVAERQQLVGPASSILFEALAELGVSDTEWLTWYATSLVKWSQLDAQSDGVPMSHRKDCEILLQQELRLVRPDYLLCLGSDASKFMLGLGVQSLVGRCVPYTFRVDAPGQPETWHTTQVMAVTHPGQVLRRPEMYDEFKTQLALFVSLTNGTEIGGKELFIKHESVYTLDRLRQIIDRLRDGSVRNPVIAVDGEWHGEYPTNKGAYLRTVQFSAAHGEAFNVVLQHQGGTDAFKPCPAAAIQELHRLLKYDPAADWRPRVGGHFFRADLPWLLQAGLDLRDEYAPAATIAEAKHSGGWDTSLAYHAVNEAASYGLTDMLVRLTTAPVYDTPVSDAVAGYCQRHGIERKNLEGYGFLPEWVLHPYGLYDADVTRRIAMRLMGEGGLLDKDWFGNAVWEPYWRAHRASLGFLEMEMNGLLLDKARIDELAAGYVDANAKLLVAFRQDIGWPAFNPSSVHHVIAFMFGEQYVKKLDAKTRERVDVRPVGAMCLNLTPLKTTGKRSKLWSDVVMHGTAAQFSPSTDRESLGILGHANPYAMRLRDLKFVTQTLRGPLRRPVVDQQGQTLVEEDGFVYEAGLAAELQDDGRVHTHLQQVKETGRASSSRPPLQNISKRREGDYSRILGTWGIDKQTRQPKYDGDYPHVFPAPAYRHAIRTVFRAAPGCVFLESDFTGAELAMMAWLSGDETMTEQVRRNVLPENHPDHFDIHSNTAVRVFRLDCPPTKKGMKAAGVGLLRVAAKNVNFGVPYGRAALAIARQCREEGVDVTEEQCQQIIDFYFEQYPRTEVFLANCRQHSQEQRWLAGPFGRYRRFTATRDRSVRGEQERQSQNFPIQNGVADAMNEAVANFTAYRREDPSVEFRLALQIHDALLFEVPIPHLRRFKAEVLRQCMIDRVPIFPRTLDNVPMPVVEPYHFGIDTEVFINWGQELHAEEAAALGIDPELL